MKLASYVRDGVASFGRLDERGLCDVPTAWPDGPPTLLDALEAGEQALARIARLGPPADKWLSPDDVQLLAPIPAPRKVIGLAGNYVKHLRESNLAKGLSDAPAVDTTPRPFLMPASAVAATGQEIAWPRFSRQIDYEVELVVVIGSRCKEVAPEQAWACIAGYTIANDVSARSTTFADGRSRRPWDEFYDWLHGKWGDGFCPMGPVLVTADEIADPAALTLSLTVNGELRQQASASQMIFDCGQIVSFVSHLMTLLPGDVIATGTPEGVGMSTGTYLRGGDVITCRIDRIGELTNRLSDPPGDFYTPCKRGS